MNTNKAHIMKKHGAFYAGTDQAFAEKRQDRTIYKKCENNLFVPKNMAYALECALKALERKP